MADRVIAAARPAYSLRRRLIWMILSVSTVLWLASLSIMTLIAWNETNEVFDDALEESGYLIMVATTDWNERSLPGATPTTDTQERSVDIQYQVVAGGRVLQRTDDAPAFPFVAGFAKKHGFKNVEVDDTRWRVFVARSAGGQFEVQVGQKYKERLDILEEIAEHLVVPMLSLLLLLGGASWFLIGRVIKPIDRTARAITQKSPDDLSQVAFDDQPSELVPIVTALNGVLLRLDSALQAERRFTADAAHELRTPLAAVHMHIQLLQRQHPALAAAFHKLRDDIGRSTALVDSLLTLARLDPASRENRAREATPLAPLLEGLERSHAAAAGERGMTLRTRCEVASIAAHPEMLRIVLRNLTDNALRYGGPGGAVEIAVQPHGDGVRVEVRDDGPGVSAADRTRLAERFFRVLGNGQSGSGLGLSIVKRIVELHGATLQFGDGLHGRGLGVFIDFPGLAPRQRVSGAS